jgi:hypothetical protein
MSKLYEEHKWSELVNDELERYGYNIKKDSYLDKLLEIANKNEKRNPRVYIIDRSLIRKIIECSITEEINIQDQQDQLEYCTNKYISELPIDVKNTINGRVIYREDIPKKDFLNNILKKGANLDGIIDLYTLSIATGNTSIPDISNIPTIILINDNLSSRYRVLAPTAIHEFIHLTCLDSVRFPGYKDLWYIKPKYNIITIPSRIDEKNINLYKIINEHIKPYSPLYRENENIKIQIHEVITELTTIRILENANIEDLYLNRKKFIEEMLNQIMGKKKEVGISKIPREDYLISYLTAYELLEKREISKNIIETIDEVLESYIEAKLKS